MSMIVGIKYQVGRREGRAQVTVVLFSLSFDKENKSKITTLLETVLETKAENCRQFTSPSGQRRECLAIHQFNHIDQEPLV